MQFLMMKSLNCAVRFTLKTLADFSEIEPLLSIFPDLIRKEVTANALVENEISAYDDDTLSEILSKVHMLNSSQRAVYDIIIEGVNICAPHKKCFFKDGPGGTGKSFLIEQMLAAVRRNHKIAIAVASSGITALLLTGGEPAHSTFGIPIKITKDSMCSISKQSDLAGFLRIASLVISDEAPMKRRNAFEADSRTLCDIMSNYDQPMGCKVVVLSGDFR